MPQRFFNSYTVQPSQPVPDTTLALACNPGDPTITVNACPPTFSLGPEDWTQVRIDNELFKVTAIDGGGLVWTVQHPVEDSAPAVHAVGAGVYVGVLTAGALASIPLGPDGGGLGHSYLG